MNAIIWELEDKLRFTRRPEVAAPNAISKQEMQALCRYAKERNVEICPLVQGLGHAGFILKHHWELRENPDSDWEFCPSDPLHTRCSSIFIWMRLKPCRTENTCMSVG